VLVVTVSLALLLFLRDMYQLSDPAIKAILRAWSPQEYYPPYTDVQEWTHSIESLCNEYGIPDIQRRQCAMGFIKEGLSTELRKVLAEAPGSTYWNQFKAFLVAFDSKIQLVTTKLPLTWTSQGISERNGRVSSLPPLHLGLCSHHLLKELPFYKKHPILTAAGTAGVLGIIGGGIAVTPIIVHALLHVGLGSAGFTAGRLGFTSH